MSRSRTAQRRTRRAKHPGRPLRLQIRQAMCQVRLRQRRMGWGKRSSSGRPMGRRNPK